MNIYMKAAADEAYEGIRNGHGGPFGAVIVKDGRIIGRGHNTVIRDNDPTCHGEMNAIRNACKNAETYDLEGAEIYTTAEPCPMCLGAILWANIGKVFYGCNVSDTEDIGFRDRKFYNMTEPEKAELMTETDRGECLQLFNEYKLIEDKKGY